MDKTDYLDPRTDAYTAYIEHLKKIDRRKRANLVKALNSLLGNCEAPDISFFSIEEGDAPENRDGVCRLVIHYFRDMQTRININANSNIATLKCLLHYLVTGSCQGLYYDDKEEQNENT